MENYKIGYEDSYIVNFVIRSKWFVKYSCTCGLQTLFFDE